MENILGALGGIEKVIENEFDFDFSVNEKTIFTEDDFNQTIKAPFEKGEKKIFYRGERINDLSRPLVPTLLRNRSHLMSDSDIVTNIDADFLLDFYKGLGKYYSVFESVFGSASKYRLYELCAFSQHYLDLSPFVDFTKSLYVALSFALKNRTEYEDDIVLYTATAESDENYTTDIVTAECWLNSYRITVYQTPESIMKLGPKKLTASALRKTVMELDGRVQESSPQAKLIDIPTNDFMKYQQGVFLLLTDFALYYKSYLTKNIRRDFTVTKYIISRDICPTLLKMIKDEAPWYGYEYLTDIKSAVKKFAGIQP